MSAELANPNDISQTPAAGALSRQGSAANRRLCLLGGIAFAVLTYVVGTIVYEIEIYISKTDVVSHLDVWGAIRRIFGVHLVTFIPWLIGNIILSQTLGRMYGQQVKFRRKAEELHARAEAMAARDGLTLLYNHQFFVDQLAIELKRTTRQTASLALLFLDIDDFKQYNDTYGHLAGDEVLRAVANATRATVRETDVVARYGGEEIVVLAIASNKEQGVRLAQRIRRKIEQSCPVTVSIGVAAFPEDGDSVNDFIRAADQAMYEAKGFGKNQVCCLGEKHTAGESPSNPLDGADRPGEGSE